MSKGRCTLGRSILAFALFTAMSLALESQPSRLYVDNSNGDNVSVISAQARNSVSEPAECCETLCLIHCRIDLRPHQWCPFRRVHHQATDCFEPCIRSVCQYLGGKMRT
jgi:hypothetical protein